MSPRRRVLLSALTTCIILVAAPAAPAHAQFYDVARGSLGFSLDAIERSPRMLGMGRLTYVGDDPHAAITLWDFAANPLGILEADSSNTAELYPSTSSLSQTHDLAGDPRTLQRQDLAGRETRVGYEIWRRAGGSSAYGVAGDLGYLRMDRVFSTDIERRSTLSQPTVMPVLVGRLPYTKSNRWLCSARMFYSGETSVDQYQRTVMNSEGEYIDQSGVELDPPEPFTATDYRVRSMGGGVGLAYDRGRAFKAAVTLDQVQNDITGKNEGSRHASQTNEKRPYSKGQVTLVGRLARDLEWGVDGRDWRSASEERWYFSVSAGVGADPLSGQGKLLQREERGQALRTRLRWKRGPLELGGGLATGYRKVLITPPGLDDFTSFNYFRNTLSHQLNADSLMAPDSVVFNQSEERTWEAGGGLTLLLPGGRGTWGVEYHRLQGLTEQILGGPIEFRWNEETGQLERMPSSTHSQRGPFRKSWDVRTGLEYRCTSVMTGRAGYMYRWEDQDTYTRQNEYLGNTMTLGLGIKPAGAGWTLEAGYAVEWQQAKYGTPAVPRASRQQLASMLRWAF